MYNNRVIKLIVATDMIGGIGCKNSLMWRLPNELKHYKENTLGNTLIVGRKTFDALPKVAKEGRMHFVISRTDMSEHNTEFVKYFTSIEDALSSDDVIGDIIVIGGGSIYKQALKYVDVFMITNIEKVFDEADTFFPLEDLFSELHTSISYSEVITETCKISGEELKWYVLLLKRV